MSATQPGTATIQGAMTLDEFIGQTAAEMSERTLQTCVLAHARWLGYKCYHTHNSRHSGAGFPDIVAISRDRNRIWVAELKREGKKPSKAQAQWLDYFAAVGIDAYVWTPSSWLSGEIQKILERE
jgi:hypothetical protein